MVQVVLILLTLLFPVQLGFHFWPTWSFPHGLSVDFLSPTLYLTDLLLVILFLLQPIPRRFFAHWRLLALLALTLNLIFSLHFLNSLFFALRLILLTNLARIIAHTTISTLKLLFFVLLLSTLVISLIGLLQFYLQSSLNGPFYFLGERHFNLTTPGIAKIALPTSNQLILRAYSTFSHPNSFAGYLALSLILFVSLAKPLRLKSFLFNLTLSLASFALITTFSRAAFLSLPIALVSLALPLRFLPPLFFFITLSITLITSLPLDLSSHPSLTVRQTLNGLALQAIVSHPLVGLGLNNFILYTAWIKNTFDHHLLQPAHNIYLLFLAEFGLISSFILLMARPRLKINHLLIPPLVVVLITGALDHYWLTLPQNRLLLAFVLGLLFNQNLPKTAS